MERFIKTIIFFVLFIRNAIKVAPLTLVISAKAVFKGLNQGSVGNSYKKGRSNRFNESGDNHAFKQAGFITLKINDSLSLIELYPFKANLSP